MSGLPSFFQQRGKTVLDELADYELGGDLDEEELEEEDIGDDTAFDDNFIGSDTELPSFFQSTATEKVEPLSVPENDYPVRSEDVNLSQLLKNFTWPGKGDSEPTAAAPMALPPHAYYEMLARNSAASSELPSSSSSSAPPPNPMQFGNPNVPGTPPVGTNPSMLMQPPGFYQQNPSQAHPLPPQFSEHGPPNPQFYHQPPHFFPPPMQSQQLQPQDSAQSGSAHRGPPSADPRLQMGSSGQRPPPPLHPYPYPNMQGPPPHPQMMQQRPPQMQQLMQLHLQTRPEDQNAQRMGIPGHQIQGGGVMGPPFQFQQTPGSPAPPDPASRAAHPKSEMMTSSDMRFVISKVVQPLNTTDPYSDDYYFLQSNLKKHTKKVEAAMQSGGPVPRPSYLPFPAWMETKNRLAAHIEDERKSYGEKSREWEEKEQVLGHMQRTDVSRPREQLHAPTLQEMLEMDSEIDGDTVFRMPFVSRLWNMRQAVQRGYEALYTLQELNHLLLSPMVLQDPYARDQILLQIDSAVSLLSQSVGIRATPDGVHRGSGGLGTGTGAGSEIALEGGLVAAILQTAKGKKLISRSINLLFPEHRWALLPVILARVLQSDPTDQSIDEQAVEKKLLNTLVQFIEHSHEYQRNQQALCASGGSAPFTSMLLGNLRLCVKSVMVSQMEKSKLRATLKFSRDRAVVMNAIVQIGDEVAGAAGETIALEWAQMREAFMCMLDE